jgi:hypothetical protein
MSTQEYSELREMIETVGRKQELILSSLKKCQGRCHVDNPPGRWTGLGRALMALFGF